MALERKQRVQARDGLDVDERAELAVGCLVGAPPQPDEAWVGFGLCGGLGRSPLGWFVAGAHGVGGLRSSALLNGGVSLVVLDR